METVTCIHAGCGTGGRRGGRGGIVTRTEGGWGSDHWMDLQASTEPVDPMDPMGWETLVLVRVR